MKTFLAILLALLCSVVAQANPHPKLKHVAELVYNFGLPAGTSLLATHEIHKCRQEFGIGPCPQGGYGSFRAREGLRFSISLGMGTLSHFWHKEDSSWETFLPSTASTTYNIVTAVRAARHSGPKETD